ncbi:PD-(D/E)XK nuclease family protein [Variovorax sp. VNK109]|uniref:PD-(D/E)XK nuclease family protein n=1 Tax=Variovorax sp. VNK109 TaxID=3400919 RepID=UPI003C066E80
MNDIAKSDDAAPARDWLEGVRAHLSLTRCHPLRTVVLLPFAQMLPAARAEWARGATSGFVPRFETTHTWARALGGFVPQPEDISFDMARDGLTARLWIERAGLSAEREVLAPRLVESAHALAQVAAAKSPSARAAWAADARAAVSGGLDNPMLALESAVARVAVEWAAASGYATDVLFEAALADDVECIAVIEGFQHDALAHEIARSKGARAVILPLAHDFAARGAIALHAARDPEDEAERAAACVLNRLNAGVSPVALVATDRTLTRRVRALLDAAGVPLRDETGWKLSTTRAAASWMVALRACARQASTDAVLDWLKNAPAFDARSVSRLEALLRREGMPAWSGVRHWLAHVSDAENALVIATMADEFREAMNAARPLTAWLAATRQFLQACGQWEPLATDAAGARVLAALHLDEEDAAGLADFLARSPYASRRMSHAQFMAWANEALEAMTFKPGAPRDAPVVILPLLQLPAWPFEAVVLPGSDEVRLAASPEPPGPWTALQRELLGLPSRALLDGSLLAAWRFALGRPLVDVLWRAHDAGGEAVLPSPLVQALLLQGAKPEESDPRPNRQVLPQPTPLPMPRGDALPVTRLSASSYEDLRRCPYRFFALRQLGLREADELDVEVDKRDFGNWLHAVLRLFHEALRDGAANPARQRAALLDEAAATVTRRMGLEDDQFLPFASAWPRLRDGYLDWLAGHEADGGRFSKAEFETSQPLGEHVLHGYIDRIDQLPDGSTFVIDYKTEPRETTRQRIRTPLEDTQIAFYAALLPDDTLRAAYVNVGERDGTHTYEQDDLVAARDALIDGILVDMSRIAQGMPLPALGEGSACEYCSARGLCRKDFWEAA